MFDDLTLVICSYNTPKILDLCLKSYVYHHNRGPHKIVIVENSTEEATRQFLDSNQITYLKNPGGTHSLSIDKGLNIVDTKYSLLIDTDIVFRKNIGETFEIFKDGKYTLMGEIQANRGGFLLYPRVAPYFCFINMKSIRSSNIRFHNEQKIAKTNSTDFFQNIPINHQNENKRFYDVGSTFFEEIQKHNFRISNLESIDSIVFHAESLSWAIQSGIEEYMNIGKERRDRFYNIAGMYDKINIKGCYVSSLHQGII